MSVELAVIGIVGCLVAIWLVKKFVKVMLFLGMVLAAIYFLAPTLAGSFF